MKISRTRLKQIIREEISGALREHRESGKDLSKTLSETLMVTRRDSPYLQELIPEAGRLLEQAQLYVAAQPFALNSGQRIPAGATFATTPGWGPQSEKGLVQVHLIPSKIAMIARKRRLGMDWMIARGHSGESWYVSPEIIATHAQPERM